MVQLSAVATLSSKTSLKILGRTFCARGLCCRQSGRIATAYGVLIERHVDRVIIGPQAVEVRLTPSEAKEPPELHRDELDASGPTFTPLMLPWEAPAFVAVKGIVHTPTAAPAMAPEARDALLAAIAKARGWIEELRLGRVATLAAIAECEGLCERHVRVLAPLAFVAPRVIAAIADGSLAGYATVTGLAQQLPDSWAEQERRHKV
jgi:site-specific DNA recombinase